MKLSKLGILCVILLITLGGFSTVQSSEKDFQELLQRQLSMTQETWMQLKSHGVTDKTSLKLDFWFYAPSKQSAESCKNHLQHFEYKVSIRPESNKLWLVAGNTQSTEVTQEILLQWVNYMVTAGWEFGCYFDGWGAEVP